MRTRTLLIGGFAVLALAAGAVSIPLFYGHQHCIVNGWMMLKAYASEHGGKFPEHVQGFGDALKLATTDGYDTSLFSGPGNNGRWLLASGDIDEGHASRIYVQGLTESSNGRIALLFDRRSTPGGDHRRWFWGTSLREVATIDPGMMTITDEKWPAYVREQIELLIKEGISREAAVKLYEMTGWKDYGVLAK